MDINIYDVIVKPIVTTKSQRLNTELKKLVLEVHPQATKPMIARALKSLFNAEVESINLLVLKGKKKKVARRKDSVTSPLRKRAIIQLKEGTEANASGLTSLSPHVAPVNFDSE